MVPANPAAGRSPQVRKPLKVHNTRYYYVLFRTESCSSERRQCSERLGSEFANNYVEASVQLSVLMWLRVRRSLFLGFLDPEDFATNMFIWPCITTNFILIKPTDALIFSKFIFFKKLYMFVADPLPIIRSSPLYIRHWYLSFKFDDSFQARSECSILVVLESCHQTCMTYTSAECTVENS